MSFPGYNVAATIPTLFARQSGGVENASDEVDKWAIGNDTVAAADQYRWIFIVDETILVRSLLPS